MEVFFRVVAKPGKKTHDFIVLVVERVVMDNIVDIANQFKKLRVLGINERDAGQILIGECKWV